mmetsp:Transcript_15898/g.17655  ORF Transcript_15898/g.17655 Transcript_15898/m.17655 type:complete len:280 (-) Transcript_15898:80-919(-)
MSLRGRTLFITGGSRGIGKAIGIRAAKDGANVVIVAKTVKPHPKLPGTIYTAAKEIEEAGGQALAVQADIRFYDQIEAAVDKAVRKFGGIDIVINNASAISLTGTLATTPKRYDLMNQVNARGTFMTSKACLPYLLKSKNPHILAMSPPLDMNPIWFKNHTAYTIAKYGMSMCVLGMAAEFKSDGVAVNALWPRTTIATAAVQNLLGGDSLISRSRTPEILADAAHYILTQPSSFTGKFCIDDDILKGAGVTNFDKYLVDPSQKDNLAPDFFVPTNAKL